MTIAATDSVLIQNGIAWQIWPGTAKAALPPMHAALLAQVVEVAAASVKPCDVWNGSTFSPAPTPDVILSYGDFRLRWTDAEKASLHAACAAMWQIDDFVGLARAQGSVNVSSTTGLAAKAALVTAGVLTQARANVIFSAGGV